ncbi:MAG: hypothetical protein K2M96_01820 [Prevotella sp.]|nr:hypothetical protein [Prevotella sp.]
MKALFSSHPADAFRTMRRPHPHRVPTASAPCADTLRIVCRYAPHHVPIRSASCADTLRIVCQYVPYIQPIWLKVLKTKAFSLLELNLLVIFAHRY